MAMMVRRPAASLVPARGHQQDAEQGHRRRPIRRRDLPPRWVTATSRAGRWTSCGCPLHLPINPPDQVTVRDVVNEQIQRIGGLVEPTVAQVVARHRTMVDMVGLGTGPADLVVPATIVMPVALELRAGGAATDLGIDVTPSRRPCRSM